MNAQATDAVTAARGGWRAYARLMRLHRPIGTLLLLWPTLWALWLAAEGLPDLGVLAVFVLGTLLMRSAGCVINDYADRNFDGHVERTRDRPLATGEIEPRRALVLFGVLVLFGLLLNGRLAAWQVLGDSPAPIKLLRFCALYAGLIVLLLLVIMGLMGAKPV